MANESSVRNNEQESRFEYEIDGSVAVAEYHRDGSRITFTHTEVPEALSGRGIGNTLVRGALDYARREKLRVIPQCAFVAAFIKKNTEYQDLVDREGGN